MNFRYLLGCIISIPLLPIMYFQSKRIRASVPKLPEATGNEGIANPGSSNQQVIHLITLGESTIAGVGVDTHEEGFTGTLASSLARKSNRSVHWKVYARSGYTANRVTEKLVPKIIEDKVDLFVIGLGANDAFTLNSPQKWRQAIHNLIQNLHEKYPNACIVFCNMPPIKEFPAFTPLIKFTIGNLVEILGQELKKLVSEYSYAFYFDEKISLKGWIEKFQLEAAKEEFFSDGVHPSKLTYQTWAEDVAKNIMNSDQILKALEKE